MAKILRFNSVEPWTIREHFKFVPWYSAVAGEERDEIRQKLKDNFMADTFFAVTGIVSLKLVG